MDSKNENKTLIRKYLNHQCTAHELADLKKLVKLPHAQKLFDEVLEESWTGLAAEKNINQPYLNQQLNKIHKKIGINDNTAEAPVVNWFSKNRRFLSYAAVWVGLVIGCIINYAILRYGHVSAPKIVMHEMSNANGQWSKIILPDSSEVFLGTGSKLTVPDKFTGNLREVKLEGEAFFHVTKNPLMPFIIHTGIIQTKVLGTSFKIEAFKDHPLSVSVVTGRVRVDKFLGHNHTSLAVLTPGHMVTYEQNQATLETVEINDILLWKEGRQVFKNQPLNVITDVLERWYNVKFQYQNIKKSTEHISITLTSKMPLDDVMKVLSITGHLKYSIKGKKVTIN